MSSYGEWSSSEEEEKKDKGTTVKWESLSDLDQNVLAYLLTFLDYDSLMSLSLSSWTMLRTVRKSHSKLSSVSGFDFGAFLRHWRADPASETRLNLDMVRHMNQLFCVLGGSGCLVDSPLQRLLIDCKSPAMESKVFVRLLFLRIDPARLVSLTVMNPVTEPTRFRSYPGISSMIHFLTNPGLFFELVHKRLKSSAAAAKLTDPNGIVTALRIVGDLHTRLSHIFDEERTLHFVPRHKMKGVKIDKFDPKYDIEEHSVFLKLKELRLEEPDLVGRLFRRTRGSGFRWMAKMPAVTRLSLTMHLQSMAVVCSGLAYLPDSLTDLTLDFGDRHRVRSSRETFDERLAINGRNCQRITNDLFSRGNIARLAGLESLTLRGACHFLQFLLEVSISVGYCESSAKEQAEHKSEDSSTSRVRWSKLTDLRLEHCSLMLDQTRQREAQSSSVFDDADVSSTIPRSEDFSSWPSLPDSRSRSERFSVKEMLREWHERCGATDIRFDKSSPFVCSVRTLFISHTRLDLADLLLIAQYLGQSLHSLTLDQCALALADHQSWLLFLERCVLLKSMTVRRVAEDFRFNSVAVQRPAEQRRGFRARWRSSFDEDFMIVGHAWSEMRCKQGSDAIRKNLALNSLEKAIEHLRDSQGRCIELTRDEPSPIDKGGSNQSSRMVHKEPIPLEEEKGDMPGSRVVQCAWLCGARFEESDWRSHDEVCPKILIHCGLCEGGSYHRCDQTRHWMDECHGYRVHCQLCGSEMSRPELTKHYDECPELKKSDRIHHELRMEGWLGHPSSERLAYPTARVWVCQRCGQRNLSALDSFPRSGRLAIAPAAEHRPRVDCCEGCGVYKFRLAMVTAARMKHA